MAQATTDQTRGRLPAARRDRRPALAALALLLILLGALGSALIAFRSGDRISVLVAADDIPIGKTVERSDFVETSVAADADNLITADSAQLFVGSRATVGVPAGTLVNRQMFTKNSIVPNGAALVGVVVSPSQRTSSLPRPGDVVRLFYVSGSGQQASAGGLAPGEKVVDAARVVFTGSGQGSDSRNVTVLVDVNTAGDVAEYASSGHLALSILPSGTIPRPDLQKVE
jgi:hypothetical protein